jgi:TPR repeat protein
MASKFPRARHRDALLERAVDSGRKPAVMKLAEMYINGVGVPQSVEEGAVL